MKAVLLRGFGGFDQLEYREDVAVPEPRAGEVRVQIGAAGVNNTDINTRTAWYSRSVTEGTTAAAAAAGHGDAATQDSGWSGVGLAFPRIQGADACGRILDVGAGVDPDRIGERVLVEPVFRAPGSRWPHGAIYFGSECDGAFAEFACVPSTHAHRIESSLSDVELAGFPCAYSAAENMLSRAAVTAADTVLITGASGGVGSAAVQLARCRGATVITVAGADKTAALESLGASQVIDRGVNVAQVLGSECIDVVIDVVGGAAFPSLLDVLRRGGRYAVAGAIAGPLVELDLRTLYLKDLRLLGCTVLDEEVFPTLIRTIQAGRLQPLIAGVFALKDIVAAQRQFLAKRHLGKIVLVPNE